MPTAIRVLLSVLGSLIVGALIAAVGTVLHRSTQPWGMVVALALVLTAAVGLRAAGGRAAGLGYLVGLAAGIQVLAGEGPGGDVLIPASDSLGWVWVIGAVLIAVLVTLVPAAWFADVPLRRPRAS